MKNLKHFSVASSSGGVFSFDGADPHRLNHTGRGDYLWITNDYDVFSSFFGFPPDFQTTTLDLDGDDSLTLRRTVGAGGATQVMAFGGSGRAVALRERVGGARSSRDPTGTRTLQRTGTSGTKGALGATRNADAANEADRAPLHRFFEPTPMPTAPPPTPAPTRPARRTRRRPFRRSCRRRPDAAPHAHADADAQPPPTSSPSELPSTLPTPQPTHIPTPQPSPGPRCRRRCRVRCRP